MLDSLEQEFIGENGIQVLCKNSLTAPSCPEISFPTLEIKKSGVAVQNHSFPHLGGPGKLLLRKWIKPGYRARPTLNHTAGGTPARLGKRLGY